MRIWLALIIAPLLALTDQTVAYALVGWACAHQSVAPLHAVHALFLAMTLACTSMAWQKWREELRSGPRAEPLMQLSFLSALATASALLSSVAIVAMWLAAWMIPSCVA